MSDEIDRAQEREQLDRQLAISAALAGAKLEANGKCHNCNDDVKVGEKFCDVYCRNDYDARMRRERQRYIPTPLVRY